MSSTPRPIQIQPPASTSRNSFNPIPSLKEWQNSYTRSIHYDPVNVSSISLPISPISEPNQEQEALINESITLPPSSTLAQSIFNSINVLMGIGLLSLPFALSQTGWIIGLTMLITFAFLTRYTAALLQKCLDYNNSVTYSDMGFTAFGKSVFLLELFAASVALLILISDSITTLFPLDPIMVKVATTAVLTLSTFPKQFSILSYGSFIGILALGYMIVVIVASGATKMAAPGSLWTPMPTSLYPPNLKGIPVSIGLLMSGYAGHSVFPAVYSDMTNPNLYPKVLNTSYAFTLLSYLLISVTGYLMYGESTTPEITINLKSAAPWAYTSTVILVAVNPATKYPLTLAPIIACAGGNRILVGTFLSALVLLTSIALPEFHSVMGILGSAFALYSFSNSSTISVVFPALCWLKIGQVGANERILLWFIVIFGSLLGFAGTIGAIVGVKYL